MWSTYLVVEWPLKWKKERTMSKQIYGRLFLWFPSNIRKFLQIIYKTISFVWCLTTTTSRGQAELDEFFIRVTWIYVVCIVFLQLMHTKIQCSKHKNHNFDDCWIQFITKKCTHSSWQINSNNIFWHITNCLGKRML